MNEETAQTDIRVREAEKAHNIRTFSKGRSAKKKDPDCIQIRVLLWCRWWDFFAAMDIGVFRLRSALRVRACRVDGKVDLDSSRLLQSMKQGGEDHEEIQ